MATRAELDAYNLIVEAFPGTRAEVWDGKQVGPTKEAVVDVEIDDPSEVKSRMPKEVYMVTWKGRTVNGRKQLLGFTFTKKTDAVRVYGHYVDWQFEDVKIFRAFPEWTEYEVGKPKSVVEMEKAGAEVLEMFPA